jgi:hypothetical protein
MEIKIPGGKQFYEFSHNLAENRWIEFRRIIVAISARLGAVPQLA